MDRKAMVLKKTFTQMRSTIQVGTMATKLTTDPQTYLFDSDSSSGPCCRITRRRQTSDLVRGAVKKLTYANAKASAMETVLFSKEDEEFMERVENAMKLARMVRRFSEVYREYEQKGEKSKMWAAYKVLVERQDARKALLQLLSAVHPSD
ncbi:hypothetical protein CRM22_001565 [Opisthorchis felineus]|uniref:Uncharacterized protein n=1 Tax=Opisthorchis felineus TaxID=147828 RepID=A0A4V3SGR6_OPIFE|nr:hypothetical protein CRM22_001565 [Opisthorchis felineus]